jgi:hypothetical protein
MNLLFQSVKDEFCTFKIVLLPVHQQEKDESRNSNSLAESFISPVLK